MIKITIIRDFDGFFELWAKRLVDELEKVQSPITEITVNSGPYRNYGMEYKLDNIVLHLDFYSAIRTGFGSIGCTPKELAEYLK